MSSNPTAANRLAHETSPYLRQHAHNPVDWYPWGEEALTLAAEQNRPILLSIGYSACHWCHVMAHESFENAQIAAVMNERFVNIKVDREERPDLDKIYQLAHAALTRRNGGWPLTMFLTPRDQVPFYGGTYFPDAPRHGLPGFADVLQRISAYFRDNPEDIRQQSDAMRQFYSSLHVTSTTKDALTRHCFRQARGELAEAFDARNGGFGRAPKFPHPTNLDSLLRHWWHSQTSGQSDEKALQMVTYSLQKMAQGGVFDQLGGGFFRYSTDDYWMVPHFEKMLYDNGPLLSLYADAWTATSDPLFRQTALDTATWIMRDMQSAEGGYFSSLDADSDGEEGKYYRWHRDEVREVLGEETYRVFAMSYGLDQPANFEGLWHLHTFMNENGVANQLRLSAGDVAATLGSARDQLLQHRSARTAPDRDEKILTSWNALTIKAMARAGRYLQHPEFVESANRALGFIRAVLWQNERLLASYKDDRAAHAGYLDDYAFLLDALLELLQARWRVEDLVFATRIADALLEHFIDAEQGGFYFTAGDHEKLIHRLKPMADEAMPAGNGVAAVALNRLGHLLGESRYIDAAERTLAAAANHVRQSAMAHASILHAYEEILSPPEWIVLRGELPQLQQWTQPLARQYAPHRFVLQIPADAQALPSVLDEKQPRGEAVAYICRGTVCSAPIDDFNEYLRVTSSSAAVAG